MTIARIIAGSFILLGLYLAHHFNGVALRTYLALDQRFCCANLLQSGFEQMVPNGKKSRQNRHAVMMRRNPLILSALLLLIPMLSTSCGMGEQTPQGYKNTSIVHAHDHWKQGAASPIPFTFIDVRTPEEFAKGHIPGATLIPVHVLFDRIDEIPHDKQLYLYCHSGKRSSHAATILADHGFQRIENIVGGIVAWKKEGYEISK